VALDALIMKRAQSVEEKVAELARQDGGEGKVKGYLRMLERNARAESES
jgi:hypothetical protein